MIVFSRRLKLPNVHDNPITTPNIQLEEDGTNVSFMIISHMWHAYTNEKEYGDKQHHLGTPAQRSDKIKVKISEICLLLMQRSHITI